MSNSTPAPRIAYLASEYPATSHTFILREVIGLREHGFDIATASINPDRRPATRITPEERAERDSTYVVKCQGLPGAIAAHAWALVRHSSGYWRGLGAAIGRSSSPRTLAWSIFHFTEALILGRWMRGRGITHLHVHFATAAASVASLARRTLPITLSMTVHGPDEFANVRAEHFSEKVAAADFVVCISHFARGQAMNHSAASHWNKLSVVRLGIIPADHAAASRCDTADGRFTLLCVGRLTPAKGQHLLIEAMRRIVAAGRDDIELILAGDGPDADSLRTQSAACGLAKHVRFTGALNRDEVRDLYANADAFVLPSFAEGIPVVLMEAMASGLPCLTTRIAGIPELIEDGRDGMLVPASDVDALVERILALADDAPLRARLGEAARRRVAAEYDLDQNIGRLATLFRNRLTGVAA